LAKIDYCGITTDCWTSNANHSYMGLTVHFVDNEFKFNSVEIALRYLVESHTSEYLKKEIYQILTRFGLMEKAFAGSSDTANNIKHTIKDLMPSLMYIPCFCHKLNLLVKDCFLSGETTIFSGLLAKCRKLVGLFKHSNLLSEQLATYQKTNNLPVVKLKQEVPTRWNSSYLMLQSITKAGQAIQFVLLDPSNQEHRGNLLTGSEMDLLNKLLELLQPMFYLTTKLSTEKFPPCSLVIPSIEKLESYFKEIQSFENNFNLKGKHIQL
jgi:hypothetical protein